MCENCTDLSGRFKDINNQTISSHFLGHSVRGAATEWSRDNRCYYVIMCAITRRLLTPIEGAFRGRKCVVNGRTCGQLANVAEGGAETNLWPRLCTPYAQLNVMREGAIRRGKALSATPCFGRTTDERPGAMYRHVFFSAHSVHGRRSTTAATDHTHRFSLLYLLRRIRRPMVHALHSSSR